MIFFLIASIIFVLMHTVTGLWIFFLFPSIGWKMPALWLPLLCTTLMLGVLSYTRTHYGSFETVLYMAAYTWMGLIFMAFCIALGSALLQTACTALHIPTKWLGLMSLGLFILAVVLSLYGGWKAPRLRTLPIHIAQMPPLKAAVISDSHLGSGVSLARFQRVLARMQAEKPDILFVLGDLFEYGADREKYAQALADFHTPYGSFGVLGNHEYYVGYENSVDFYRQAGITLLQNEVHSLPNGVQIIGLKDIQTAGVNAQQLAQLLEQTSADKPRILLSHQPLLTEVAAQYNIDLMLSGHTHNGQIFPFNYLVKLKYPHVYGLYAIGPHSQLYVTSGLFYWGIPLRLLAPSEIPLLHLQGNV